MARYSRYSESQSTLSEDTDEIVSFWQKYLSSRKQRARKHRGHRRLPSETATATTSHSATTSAGTSVAGPSRQHIWPRPTSQFAVSSLGRHGGTVAGAASLAPDQASSSEGEYEWDEGGVRWARALCVALLALGSALFVGALALSLMHSLPDSWTSRPHRSALHPFVMHAPETHRKGTTKGVSGRRLLEFHDADAPNDTTGSLELSPSETTAVHSSPAMASTEPYGTTTAVHRSPTVASTEPSGTTTAVPSSPTMESTEPSGTTTIRADGEITAPEVDASNLDKCGAVFFKFCFKSWPGYYYYSREANACLPLSGPGTEVCNRSPNRFVSLESCSRQCTQTKEPAGKCFEKILLSRCGRDDLVKGSKLWAFDGHGCRFWHFPRGQCPSEKDQLFGSLAECSKTCLGVNGTDTPSPCQPPAPMTCNSHQLKYPFFAYKVGGGKRVHCMTALLAAREANRCLEGPNMYPTVAACRAACIPAGHRAGINKD